jgi:hypothetical protein
MHPTVKKLPAGLTATNSRGTDYGVICLITDFNAKVSAVYLVLNDRRLPLATQSARQFVLGVQLQY